MTWQAISTGGPYEQMAPYSRALFDDDWVFVAGTTGMRYPSGAAPGDVVEQTREALRTIARVLGDAGSSLDEIVQFLAIVTDRSYVQPVMRVLSDTLTHRPAPAGTMLIAGLVREDLKVEIQVTARKGLA